MTTTENARSTSRLDPHSWPATALLLDQAAPSLGRQPAGLSLAAATSRAHQIVAHAMHAGDHATAALMTEAFARLALHSPAAADAKPSERPSPRERAALRYAASMLIKQAYPAEWNERQMASEGGPTDTFDLSSIGKSIGEGDRPDSNDYLDELLRFLFELEATV